MIFIVGTPSSGTSMLAKILWRAGFNMGFKVQYKGKASRHRDYPMIEDHRLRQVLVYKSWPWGSNTPICSPEEAREMLADYVRQRTKASNGPLAAKGWIQASFYDGQMLREVGGSQIRYLYIRREKQDMLDSLMRYKEDHRGANIPAHAAALWDCCDTHQKLFDYHFRYDDFIAHPPVTVEALIDELGLSVSPTQREEMVKVITDYNGGSHAKP